MASSCRPRLAPRSRPRNRSRRAPSSGPCCSCSPLAVALSSQPPHHRHECNLHACQHRCRHATCLARRSARRRGARSSRGNGLARRAPNHRDLTTGRRRLARGRASRPAQQHPIARATRSRPTLRRRHTGVCRSRQTSDPWCCALARLSGPDSPFASLVCMFTQQIISSSCSQRAERRSTTHRR
jgi:hypothetical protein